MDKDLIASQTRQVPPYEAPLIAQGLTVELGQFLFPLLVEVDTLLDKRLVRTCAQLIAVILTFRDRANGLLLSELGGSVLSALARPRSRRHQTAEQCAAFGQVDGSHHHAFPVAACDSAAAAVG